MERKIEIQLIIDTYIYYIYIFLCLFWVVLAHQFSPQRCG